MGGKKESCCCPWAVLLEREPLSAAPVARAFVGGWAAGALFDGEVICPALRIDRRRFQLGCVTVDLRVDHLPASSRRRW